jgi:FkbM family methyltransferase
MKQNIGLVDRLFQYRVLELYEAITDFVMSRGDRIRVGLLYLGLIKKAKINTKDGNIVVNSLREYRIAFDRYYKKKVNIAFLIKIARMEYGWLNVRNKKVVDIGANVGDTAIYFAKEGAIHVYAYEPYPFLFNKARKNVRNSGYSTKITLNNAAVLDREGTLRIREDYKADGGTDLKKFETGKLIQLITLSSIITKTNISNGVLKLDCEGSEYQILLRAKISDLRKFDQIALEYHYGYLNLKNKLEEAGFQVRNTRPRKVYNTQATNPYMKVGLMFAKRL